MNESSTENEPLEISKSQRKRDAHKLLDLAEKLISMPESRLKRIPLDQELREAVEFCRSIKAHGARKRQLMTVAKMLRKRDNEGLIDAVLNFDRKNRQINARFHHIETWRDRLVAGTDHEFSELCAHIPDANVQILRQLIRNAKKEQRLEKSPASARKLFKLLRDMDAEQALPPLTE